MRLLLIQQKKFNLAQRLESTITDKASTRKDQVSTLPKTAKLIHEPFSGF